MFGLTKLLTDLSALADNLNALAGTVAEINCGLRVRLALGGTTPPETAVLTHQPPRERTDGGGPGHGPPERARRGRGQDGA
jgi:hypothetical protein